MNELDGSPLPVTVVRWIARILSALILVFWGFFIIAHLVGAEGGTSRPLYTSDYVLLATMAMWLAGLAVAWKWELVGGTMTLGALAIAAVFNWRVLTFPGLLIAITAVLFLSTWWMSRVRAGGTTVTQATTDGLHAIEQTDGF